MDLTQVFPQNVFEVFVSGQVSIFKVQTVEKVVEVPMVGQTLQGTTQEVDIPVAPRREDAVGQLFVVSALHFLLSYLKRFLVVRLETLTLSVFVSKSMLDLNFKTKQAPHI